MEATLSERRPAIRRGNSKKKSTTACWLRQNEDRHRQGPEDGENRHLQILRERPAAADGHSSRPGIAEGRGPALGEREKEEDKLKG